MQEYVLQIHKPKGTQCASAGGGSPHSPGQSGCSGTPAGPAILAGFSSDSHNLPLTASWNALPLSLGRHARFGNYVLKHPFQREHKFEDEVKDCANITIPKLEIGYGFTTRIDKRMFQGCSTYLPTTHGLKWLTFWKLQS